MNNNEFLNREREEIIIATNQVNNSIDQEKVVDVNNQFKNNAPSKKKRIIIILIVLIILLVGLFFALKLAKEVVDLDDVPTTTTTKKVSRVKEYISNINKVRKFESNNYILLLFPDNLNKFNNDNYFALINDNEINIGTYNLEEDNLNLNYNDNSIIINLLSDGLSFNNEIMSIHETEMKYYLYNGENDIKLLLINGTIGKEQAFIMISNSEEIKIDNYNYTESMESIILENGDVYNKTNNDLDNNGLILNYIN